MLEQTIISIRKHSTCNYKHYKTDTRKSLYPQYKIILIIENYLIIDVDYSCMGGSRCILDHRLYFCPKNVSIPLLSSFLITSFFHRSFSGKKLNLIFCLAHLCRNPSQIKHTGSTSELHDCTLFVEAKQWI